MVIVVSNCFSLLQYTIWKQNRIQAIFWKKPFEDSCVIGITQWNVEGPSQFSPCQKKKNCF